MNGIDYSHIVLIITIWQGDRIRRPEHSTVKHGSCDESVQYFSGMNFALITKILHTYLLFYIWSWYIYEIKVHTGCPRMFYTQKCKILRIFITIKTIEFGILIYLSDRAILLAFWRILNQGNRPNETENTWHYGKRVIFCILIEVGKAGFMSYSA